MQKIILTRCSYAAMISDVLLIITVIAFFLKYCKMMQVMLAAFINTNMKGSGIPSFQADQTARTYPSLFTINLPKMKRPLKI